MIIIEIGKMIQLLRRILRVSNLEIHVENALRVQKYKLTEYTLGKIDKSKRLRTRAEYK